MADEFHADIGPQYEGEVIRKENLQVEFGGPKTKAKFELVTLKGLDEVENEKVEIIGPDIPDMAEGSSRGTAFRQNILGFRPRLPQTAVKQLFCLVEKD